MKVIEIANNELSGFGLSEEQVKYELTKAGISIDEEITDIGKFVTSKSFELMKAGKILDIILTEAESWNQGDRGEKRNFDALKNYVSSIYRKYDLQDPFEEKKQPIIRML